MLGNEPRWCDGRVAQNLQVDAAGVVLLAPNVMRSWAKSIETYAIAAWRRTVVAIPMNASVRPVVKVGMGRPRQAELLCRN